MSDAPPSQTAILPEAIGEILDTPEGQRSRQEKLVLAAHVAHELATAELATLPSHQVSV